jgi:hypothetical protein
MMWEYEIAKMIRNRKTFLVTYFDSLKNYRAATILANSEDEALVLFSQDYPRMEILSVRISPV